MDKVWTDIFFLGYSQHGHPLKTYEIEFDFTLMNTGFSKVFFIIKIQDIPRQNMDKAILGHWTALCS